MKTSVRRRHLCLFVTWLALLILVGLRIFTYKGSSQGANQHFALKLISEHVFNLRGDVDGTQHSIDNELFKKVVLHDPNACIHPSPVVIHCVRSAVKNSSHRNLIRKAWGAKTLYHYLEMETVFFVGRTTSMTVQKQLQDESSQYRDMVQGNFEDNDQHLTGIGFILDWIQNHCINAHFILVTDDTVLVNVFRFVERFVALSDERQKKDIIWCQVISGGAIPRKPKLKRYISRKEWNAYPDFCSRGVLFFSMRTMNKLLRAAHLLPPMLMLEDVYVTGILRNKSGVQVESFSKRLTILDVYHCHFERPPELFCSIDDIEHGWKIWIGLVVIELLRMAGNDKLKRRTIVEKFYEIIVQTSNQDWVLDFGNSRIDFQRTSVGLDLFTWKNRNGR